MGAHCSRSSDAVYHTREQLLDEISNFKCICENYKGLYRDFCYKRSGAVVVDFRRLISKSDLAAAYNAGFLKKKRCFGVGDVYLDDENYNVGDLFHPLEFATETLRDDSRAMLEV